MPATFAAGIHFFNPKNKLHLNALSFRKIVVTLPRFFEVSSVMGN
jgi:hypothetical protein